MRTIQAWYLHCKQMDMLVNDATGEIIRLDMAFTPSGQWLAFGTAEQRGGAIIPRFGDDWRLQFGKIADMPRQTFKNGKPRYFLADLDHGTRRVQVSNGIRGISRPATWAQNYLGTWDAISTPRFLPYDMSGEISAAPGQEEI